MFEVLRPRSTSCGILNSFKKFGSKPCIKPMVSTQLQQELQALQAEQTEHDSLQDLTGFCKYLLC
jgi:hypothetical protein